MTFGNAMRRRGFGAADVAGAMALLAVALWLAGQLAGFATRERLRTAARHDAVEQATNVLERARAVPWKRLTPQWADEQCLPSDVTLPKGTLKVTVRPVEGEPRLKKVEVAVGWMMEMPNDVRMDAWFRDRGEEKP